MGLVVRPEEVDLCLCFFVAKSIGGFDKKKKEKGKISATVRQSVAPVVTEIDEDGRQVPREGRVPGQVNDAVVLEDVDVSRVLQSTCQYPWRVNLREIAQSSLRGTSDGRTGLSRCMTPAAGAPVQGNDSRILLSLVPFLFCFFFPSVVSKSRPRSKHGTEEKEKKKECVDIPETLHEDDHGGRASTVADVRQRLALQPQDEPLQEHEAHQQRHRLRWPQPPHQRGSSIS